MNDRWKTKEGSRWNKAKRIRAARLFRAHVDTPHNRKVNRSCRIQRERCWFCVQNARAGGYPQEKHLPLAPFHHLDYDRPFLGVWTCDSHHRKIDHGALRVPQKAMRDYTSDVALVSKRGLLSEVRRTAALRATGTDSEVPF